jgi:type IV secretory pathway TraG/TraD family ATPase VirD4
MIATVGEDKFAAGTFIKEYFTLKGESSNAYVFASNTINAPQDTKGSILSVFRQKIRLFASRENLSEMLAYSDFDMRKIGKEKTAVFIIIHDEKTSDESTNEKSLLLGSSRRESVICTSRR